MIEREDDWNSLMVVYPINCNETLSGEKHMNYRGCQSKTISGRTCQAWEEQVPHRHAWNTVAARASHGLDGPENNYCRNPDGSETIWCFIANPKPNQRDSNGNEIVDPKQVRESCEPLKIPAQTNQTIAAKSKCPASSPCPIINVDVARIASTSFKIRTTSQDGSIITTGFIKVNVIYTCTGKPLLARQ